MEIKTEDSQIPQNDFLVKSNEDNQVNSENYLDSSMLTQKAIRTIFKIPVYDKVTYSNILAIPLIVCSNMILSTFFNAQIIFLLTDPKLFNIP